jgi:hypothetical protein
MTKDILSNPEDAAAADVQQDTVFQTDDALTVEQVQGTADGLQDTTQDRNRDDLMSLGGLDGMDGTTAGTVPQEPTQAFTLPRTPGLFASAWSCKALALIGDITMLVILLHSRDPPTEQIY